MTTETTSTDPHAQQPHLRKMIFGELPYLAILVLTLAGIGYASTTHKPIEGYWVFLAVFACAASMFAGWHNTSGRRARLQLVVTQLLHWGAFLLVIGLVFAPSVQAIADADATSLLVLLLLALGTFIAGVHTLSWRLALNGVVMALFVPAVAWLDQSALIISLGAVVALFLALGAVFWMRRRGERQRAGRSASRG